MPLQGFFNPKSVAIVGASQKKGKVGYEILNNMMKAGYAGKLFPINNKTAEIKGLKCYTDLLSLGETPDLVVAVVPAEHMIEVMNQCAQIKVTSIIIISAGFKETGEKGLELEKQVVKIAKDAGIRIIGPNCLGIIVPSSKVNASFGHDVPPVGATGYLSQSGALLAAILDMAIANGIGFSKLVSFGNKSDVDELDMIESLGADPDTKVIAGYLESINKGDAFVEKVEPISRIKPVILMKSGVSAAGARAASSHTGSLAGSDMAYQCAFERAGVIRCYSVKQQFDYSQAFAYQPLPKGNKVAIVTNAGGAGIMATDAVEKEGLAFSDLTEQTRAKLAPNLPAAANIKNPVDVLGDAMADRYEFALDVVLADPNVDIVLVILTPQVMTDSKSTAEAVVKISRKYDKPVLACFMGAKNVAPGVEVFRTAGIPQYDNPEAAVNTIRAMVQYAQWRQTPNRRVQKFEVDKAKVKSIIDDHIKKGMREIGELDAKEVLKAYGFTIPEGSIAKSADEAVSIADKISYPVVMKIWSPDIIHKSDIGGVKVGVKDANEVRNVFNTMMTEIPKKKPDARLIGVYVQQMCTGGREVILGVNRDAQFGPLIMFGLGGLFVEVLKDVTFSLAPLTKDEAKRMMLKTKSYKLLEGVRGQQGVDIEQVAECLQRLSQLVKDFPQIVEMDINPLLAKPVGSSPVAVDARISVEKS